MAITALLVSKALVHSLVLSNVILGAVWIFSDDTPQTVTECAEFDAGPDGSSTGNCMTTEGLGGFKDAKGKFDGALDKNPFHYFNWHPLLMLLAFGLFYVEGAIAYRILPESMGIKRKWIHGIFMFIATALGIAGTVVVFKFHNYDGPDDVGGYAGTATSSPNLYSVHSWVGMATIILFTFQFLGGLFFFALQKNGRIRGMLIATHRMVGTLLGFCTAAAIISGVLDIQAGIWTYSCNGQPCDKRSGSIILSNWWMVVLVVTCGVTYHVLYDQEAKAVAKYKATAQQGTEPGTELGDSADDSAAAATRWRRGSDRVRRGSAAAETLARLQEHKEQLLSGQEWGVEIAPVVHSPTIVQ